MNPNLLPLLALTYVPGLGPVNQRKILKTISVQEIWNLSPKELKDIFRNRTDILHYFQTNECFVLAQKEIDYCTKNNIDILTYEDAEYPEKLKNCSDSPLVLFKNGNYDFDRKLHIGIVGTRQMTAYGKKFIDNLMEDLASQNIAIVSGLAYGCDIEAHRAALNLGIPNLAILAHGLNRISPAPHRKEAREIGENGALITEYSTFHNAEPLNFVLRNRIIAGLCDAVIVVESDKRGGALATANYANSYNREVFAVPGRIDDKFSLGCNELIQTNQAYMIRHAKDLLNYFNLKTHPKPIQKELFIELNSDQKLIYDYLSKNGKKHIDEMTLELGIPLYKLNLVLLELELIGLVKPFSGKLYGVN
jgi:DNA processing protein